MNELAIICLLPEEVNNYHQGLRQKITYQFGFEVNHNVPPHITIKYGFPIKDIVEIEEVAYKFCLSHPKTKWKLSDFGHFINPDKHVVFIDTIPMEKTRKVHASFMDSLRKINWVKWSQFDSANLHYHVTLASKGITSANFDDVWSFLNQQEKPDFKVQFDNLALLRIEKDPPFVYNIFRFPD